MRLQMIVIRGRKKGDRIRFFTLTKRSNDGGLRRTTVDTGFLANELQYAFLYSIFMKFYPEIQFTNIQR